MSRFDALQEWPAGIARIRKMPPPPFLGPGWPRIVAYSPAGSSTTGAHKPRQNDEPGTVEALYRMRPPKTIERAPAQRGGTRKTMNTEPGDKTVCFEMRITEEQERRIANWLRAQPDLPGRQEAIRKVLNRVLDEVETEENGKS